LRASIGLHDGAFRNHRLKDTRHFCRETYFKLHDANAVAPPIEPPPGVSPVTTVPVADWLCRGDPVDARGLCTSNRPRIGERAPWWTKLSSAQALVTRLASSVTSESPPSSSGIDRTRVHSDHVPQDGLCGLLQGHARQM